MDRRNGGLSVVRLPEVAPKSQNRIVQRHPIVTFFVLTYTISWAGALFIAAPHWMRGEAVPKFSGLMMFPVMLLGPIIAGITLTWAVQGRPGVRALFGRIRRIGPFRWLAALAIPPTLVLAVLLGLKTFMSPAFAPNLFPMGLAFGCTAGFFEEIGWTGFAFPAMRLNRSGFQAAVLLGLLWATWHVPVVDYLGAATPHGRYWLPFFLSFTAAMTAMRVLICWVYANTGSVLMAQMLHASSTGALAVFSPAGITAGQEVVWYAVLFSDSVDGGGDHCKEMGDGAGEGRISECATCVATLLLIPTTQAS
jgi:membrane protease YdiL (CAAX protease family)